MYVDTSVNRGDKRMLVFDKEVQSPRQIATEPPKENVTEKTDKYQNK